MLQSRARGETPEEETTWKREIKKTNYEKELPSVANQVPFERRSERASDQRRSNRI